MIPDWSLKFSRKRNVCETGSRLGVTWIKRFSRLNEATNSFDCENPSVEAISLRTRGVAVAVNAMQTAEGNLLRTPTNRRYAGRKSCPHSEMQWASSIANRATCRPERSEEGLAVRRVSGATYSRVI